MEEGKMKKKRALKEKAVVIPQEMGRCVKLSPEEAGQLYKILYKVLAQLEEE